MQGQWDDNTKDRISARGGTYGTVGEFNGLDSGVHSSGKRPAIDLREFVYRSAQVMQANNMMQAVL